MNPLESFELAIKNILASKLRALLTMLGIIVGVTAVILIVGLGNGVKNYMTNEFSSLGVNTLTVSVTGRGATSSRRLTVDNMYDIIAKNQDTLDKVSPMVRMAGPVKIGNETLSTTSVTGVSEDYFDITQYTVKSGRGLEYADIAMRDYVCVVGNYIAKEWFSGDAVGQTIKVGGSYLTIVGVMAEEAESESSSTDDCVFVPYSTAIRLSSTGTVSSYTITVRDVDKATESKQVVQSALYEIFMNDKFYRVSSMGEMLNTMTTMINIIVTVLSIIAGISLVVGGIGIMNIMLVSVTERTKEIGIRKALGAKERYILIQFVIEAATTSAIAGLIGIGLGYGLSAIATTIIKPMLGADLAVSPTFGSALMAFTISASIGIIFGFLPARKAAALNPIDALRNE